jgi:hypothetical protein
MNDSKRLKELSTACFIFLRSLDEIGGELTGKTGAKIAKLANALEYQNDLIRYGNLGVDFRKDDKDKLWRAIKNKRLKKEE